MGLTTKGSIGAKSALTLADAAKRVQALADAAKTVNPDILVLCHGGPISEPEDVQYILRAHEGHRRLLRRVEHRAPADRGGDHRLREAVQGVATRLRLPPIYQGEFRGIEPMAIIYPSRGVGRVELGSVLPQDYEVCAEVQQFSLRLEYRYEHLWFVFGNLRAKSYLLVCEVCRTPYRIPDEAAYRLGGFHRDPIPMESTLRLPSTVGSGGRISIDRANAVTVIDVPGSRTTNWRPRVLCERLSTAK